MSLTSLPFLLFCLAILGFYYLNASQSYRQLVLICANAAFIASYAINLVSLIPIFLFILFGYVSVRLTNVWRRSVLTGVMIAAFILLFIWLKQYSIIAFLPPPPFAFLAIGISYMLFRILHLIFDVRDGEIPAPSFLEYISYVCFFLSFVSGPIQRYQDFDAQRRRPQPLTEDISFTALCRIVVGYSKICVVSELLHVAQLSQLNVFLGALGPVHAVAGHTFVIHYMLAAALYALFLYANFSGYMDLVIGIGFLFGFTLPENFDRPWLAGNFLDYWSRWHITLSTWFRIYFFNPLLKAMLQIWNSPVAAPYMAVIAFFVTFLVLGAWHGSASVYLVCGFLFGTGVSLNKLYQVEMTRRLGKKRYRALTRQWTYMMFCRGLTMAYFTLSLTTFWLSISQITALISALGVAGLMSALILLTLALAVASAALDVLIRHRSTSFFAALMPTRLGARALWLGTAVFVLTVLIPAMGAAPDFVYKAF